MDTKFKEKKEEDIKKYEAPVVVKLNGYDEDNKKIELGCWDCGPDGAHC
ncbi:MAG: hypothetical protein AB1711_12210 [Thermodesulfobacteriota bacterium]